MSRFYDRVQHCLENEMRDSEVIGLWNHFAEKNYYEHIYDMSEFDEIIVGDRSYRDVKDELNDDFDENAKYFYTDTATGLWHSSNDPIGEIVDIPQLVDDLIYSRGANYPSSDVDDIFDGTLFYEEMRDILDRFGKEDLKNLLLIIDDKDESDIRDWEKEELYEALFDALEYARDCEEPDEIFQMPEAIQSKFFEFMDPDLDYVQHNIRVKGPVEPEEALRLAGFEKVDDKKSIYVKTFGNIFRRYKIEIKDGLIKSASYASQKSNSMSR